MIRGTTPTIKLHIKGVTLEVLKKIEIYLRQENELIIKEPSRVAGSIIEVKLDQEETLKFKAHIPVFVQMRAVTNAEDVIATVATPISVDEIMNDEVIPW